MDLLPPNTLEHVRVGISASPSGDLTRLGLLEGHFQLALGELGRTVLILGGNLQYCGHLEPDGYTPFLINEIRRYGNRDKLMSVVLAWPVHRQISLSAIRQADQQLGIFGSITCLNTDGVEVDCAANRSDDPPGVPDEQVAPALTAMRKFAIQQTQGRLLIGGRRSGYSGVMPGVLEEALLAIASGQPIFLAGGFGGVTYDVISMVDPAAASWLPPIDGDEDEGLRSGLVQLRTALSNQGWDALGNGLDAAENKRLAATHRPSEIATLVSLGLGRLAQSGAFSGPRSPDI